MEASTTRDFVDAIFMAERQPLSEDWALWVKQQSIESVPKIVKKENPVHPDAILALEHIRTFLEAASTAHTTYKQLKRETSRVDLSDMVQLADNMLDNRE